MNIYTKKPELVLIFQLAFPAVDFSAFHREHDPTVSQQHAYKVTYIYICIMYGGP